MATFKFKPGDLIQVNPDDGESHAGQYGILESLATESIHPNDWWVRFECGTRVMYAEFEFKPVTVGECQRQLDVWERRMRYLNYRT